jgi:hypothetical protein
MMAAKIEGKVAMIRGASCLAILTSGTLLAVGIKFVYV